MKTLLLVLGSLALAAALGPPLDALSERSFAAHMTSHVLLVFVAPPLLLIGFPWRPVVGAFAAAAPDMTAAVMRSPLRSMITFPVFTWLAFTAVMWTAHFSGLYESALEHPAVHALEHGLFFSSALLFWSTALQEGPTAWPLHPLMRMLFVLSMMPQNAFLGAILAQTQRVLYPFYERYADAATVVQSQHDGGAIMWIVGGIAMLATLLAIIGQWAADERLALARMGR